MNAASTENAPRTTTAKVRRLVLAMVCAVAAVFASTVAAPPAEAAAGLSYCFKYSTGSPYSNRPVYLKIYTNQGWTNIARGTSNYNGCGSFTMSGSYRNYYSIAYAQENLVYGGAVTTIFSGYTPNMANPGNASPYLGTGTVYCQAVTQACVLP